MEKIFQRKTCRQKDHDSEPLALYSSVTVCYNLRSMLLFVQVRGKTHRDGTVSMHQTLALPALLALGGLHRKPKARKYS